MTDASRSLFSEGFAFWPFDWGEVIKGTKLDLQRLGLGVDEIFPGEPGGRPSVLTVVDRRGLTVKIRRVLAGRAGFEARIAFPGLGWLDVVGSGCPWIGPWIEQLPGLKKRERLDRDEFLGTSTALHDAGLVRPDQLPGQPGMKRTSVMILPDGSVALNAPQFRAAPAGARVIKRASKSTYSAWVRLSEDASELRVATADLARREQSLRYAAAIAAMKRPAPLWQPPVTVGKQASGNPSWARPGYLRLVVANEGLPPQVVRQTPPAPELSLVAVAEGR